MNHFKLLSRVSARFYPIAVAKLSYLVSKKLQNRLEYTVCKRTVYREELTILKLMTSYSQLFSLFRT